MRKTVLERAPWTRSFERRVGYTQNLYRARETSANAVNAIVIGVVGGFPPHIFALSMSVSFALGIFADIPTGIAADRLGHAKALFVGMTCVGVAPIILLLAILGGFGEQFSALIVITNAIIFAFGQSLLSGAYEAYVYGMIETLYKGSKNVPATQTHDLTGITHLQKHGSYLPLLIPSLTITGALVLERYAGLGCLCLAVPGIISLWLLKYVKRSAEPTTTDPAYDHKPTQEKLRWTFLPLVFLLSLYQITIIHANAYTIVSLLRVDALNSMSLNEFIGNILASSSFFVGFFVKSRFGSIIVKNFYFKRLFYALPAGAAFLSVIAYFILSQLGPYIALFIFGALFRLFHSTAQELVMSYIFNHLHSSRRATVMSASRTLSAGSYALFSWLLLWSGLGIPSLSSIFISTSVFSVMLSISTLFLLRWYTKVK